MNEQNKDKIQAVPPFAGKQRVFQADGRDCLFAAWTAVCTFLCVSWGIQGGVQVGYAVAFVLTWIMCTVYLHKKGTRPGGFAAVCGGLSLLMTAVFVTTSNASVRLLSVPVMTALAVVWFAALCGKRARREDLGLLSLGVAFFLNLFRDLFPSLRALVSGENEKKKRVMGSLLGAFCAVPVLCVVVPLLVRSDAAFDGLIHRIFADLGAVIAQVIVSLILTPFAVSFLFSMRHREADTSAPKTHKGVEPIALASFLAVLSVCYGVYLFSQLAYFFSAFSGILPEGYAFSYAEYARRGFFELCGIAAINLVLIFVMILLARKKDNKLPTVLRAFGTFIGLFTLLLIATALSKMVLYIRVYGLTVQRLNVSAMIVFTAVVFVTVILRCYCEKVQVLQTALVSAGVILLLLGVGNVNAVTARYNYEAYQSGKLREMDLDYMVSLGEEGVPYVLKLTVKDGKAPSREEDVQAVKEMYGRLYYEEIIDLKDGYYVLPTEKMYDSIWELSVPRARGCRLLQEYMEKYPTFFADNAVKIEPEAVDSF